MEKYKSKQTLVTKDFDACLARCESLSTTSDSIGTCWTNEISERYFATMTKVMLIILAKRGGYNYHQATESDF